ncbi:hypothetical protein AAFF_G00080990 [Aldrovandia affinis]|uniref:Uncharacterized protein n=1 Tax=Aldrovandia affinis TaxID=143900 RepID=A0AAD7WY98_9TELE|nr:hypothetical protein AAFF_G00080990 [Aldrovandia affinis]
MPLLPFWQQLAMGRALDAEGTGNERRGAPRPRASGPAVATALNGGAEVMTTPLRPPRTSTLPGSGSNAGRPASSRPGAGINGDGQTASTLCCHHMPLRTPKHGRHGAVCHRV